MKKVLTIFMILFVVLFILSVIRYYSSNKNIDEKNFNRLNIDQILKKRISNLPVLVNDTNNVIEFNNSLESDKNNEKERSFWNLLKNE